MKLTSYNTTKLSVQGLLFMPFDVFQGRTLTARAFFPFTHDVSRLQAKAQSSPHSVDPDETLHAQGTHGGCMKREGLYMDNMRTSHFQCTHVFQRTPLNDRTERDRTPQEARRRVPRPLPVLSWPGPAPASLRSIDTLHQSSPLFSILREVQWLYRIDLRPVSKHDSDHCIADGAVRAGVGGMCG